MRWTSSAKTGVGTAISNQSRVWFTLSHGILTIVAMQLIDRVGRRPLLLISLAGGADYVIASLKEGLPL